MTGETLITRSGPLPHRLSAAIVARVDLLAAVCLLACPAWAQQVSIVRTDSGAPVVVAAAEATLSRSGLFLRLTAGGSIVVFGLEIAAASDAALYATLTSEHVAIAVLDGTAAVAGRNLAPGWLVKRPTVGGMRDFSRFDAAAFLATASPAIDAAARRSMESAAAAQKSGLFWGWLQTTPVNAQAPVVPTVEALRRDYLLEPAVLRIRQDTPPGELRRAVAERFVSALAARDSATVRGLLHPRVFVKVPGQRTEDWLALRARFAERLAAGALPARLQGATVGEAGADTFRLTAGDGRRYRLTLAPLDGMIFVTALEPE